MDVKGERTDMAIYLKFDFFGRFEFSNENNVIFMI